MNPDDVETWKEIAQSARDQRDLTAAVYSARAKYARERERQACVRELEAAGLFAAAELLMKGVK